MVQVSDPLAAAIAASLARLDDDLPGWYTTAAAGHTVAPLADRAAEAVRSYISNAQLPYLQGET